MADVNALNLREVSAWREKLGLMPVPLRAGQIRDERTGFVLLNGSRGSFYLDLPRVADPMSDFRNNAWSTNVGHAVSVTERDVFVQRWDRKAPERFAVTAVTKDLERFHRHLEKDAPPGEMSVIAHGIRTFRSVRQGLGNDFAASDALLAFLVMLAATSEKKDRLDVSLETWRLPPRALEIANAIDAEIWRPIVEYLVRGRAIDDLQPDIRLMLRHASGALFQEAHQLAIFDPDRTSFLFPTAPLPVKVHPNPAASGAHFTPASITRSVVERVLTALGLRRDTITVLDPACGSAEFLRETLRQLRLSGFNGHLRLIGFDISEAACAMARFSLAAEVNTEEGAATTMVIDVDIRCVDALRPDTTWPSEVDLILTNPPFVSWSDMDEGSRAAVRDVLGNLMKQRPDMAAAFLFRASAALRDGGVLGSVVPASMFDGTSSAKLREALGEVLAADLVARLGSHNLFQGARVDAGLYIGVRGDRRPGTTPLAIWADHRDASTSGALRTVRRLGTKDEDQVVVVRDGYNIYPNPEIGEKAESWAPRPYEAWKTSELVKGLPSVGAVFDVRQGILTGLNKVFLLDDAELVRLPQNERFAFRRAIVNESISGGRVVSTVWLFYPHGETAIDSEEDLQRRLPTYYANTLAPAKAQLRFARVSRTETDWWKLTRHRAWQVDAQPKIVSTYFGDRGSFAWDERGDLAVVQGYAWFPKSRKTPLARNAWLGMLAILNSRAFSRLLSAHANHVGGGQWNLSKRYVSPIPIPDVLISRGAHDPALLIELGSIGERVHISGLERMTGDEQAKLEDLVANAYGLEADL